MAILVVLEELTDAIDVWALIAPFGEGIPPRKSVQLTLAGDFFVGCRTVQRYPEGNFLTPRGEYRVRALHVGPQAGVWRIRPPRGIQYPLVPYPMPPEPRRPNTGQPPTVGTWVDTGRVISCTPPSGAECNRERSVVWYAVTPSCARSLLTVSSDG